MGVYSLSKAASKDLRSIARYTVKTFGVQQAKIYGESFQVCFKSLAKNPLIGRENNNIRLGLRRFEHKSHAIFYIQREESIFVIRVLHTAQDPEKHL